MAVRATASLLARAIRYFARRVHWLVGGAAQDAWESIHSTRDPLVPPRRQIFIGEGDFRATGHEFRELFIDLGGLTAEDDVLDVGSGIGRIAVGLTGFLDGRYEGFDVVRKGVTWSQQEITPRYPNFHFQRADIFNKRYNRGGHELARDYRFPYEDGSFDFIFLASVFTHLLPDDAEHYVEEIGRVMRPAERVSRRSSFSTSSRCSSSPKGEAHPVSLSPEMAIGRCGSATPRSQSRTRGHASQVGSTPPASRAERRILARGQVGPTGAHTRTSWSRGARSPEAWSGTGVSSAALSAASRKPKRHARSAAWCFSPPRLCRRRDCPSARP
jgi:SAM-dependent methyltransferase